MSLEQYLDMLWWRSFWTATTYFVVWLLVTLALMWYYRK